MSVCALLNKPSRREIDVNVKWTGFDIPDEFVIGYGIDFAQHGRNLPHIGFIKNCSKDLMNYIILKNTYSYFI